MITWNPVLGEYTVTVDGIIVPDAATLHSDQKKYVARVRPLCGGNFFNLEGTPKQSIAAGNWAREAQLEASIAHATRKGCKECERRFQTHVNHSERQMLWARDYTLGPILGLDVHDPGKKLLLP